MTLKKKQALQSVKYLFSILIISFSMSVHSANSPILWSNGGAKNISQEGTITNQDGTSADKNCAVSSVDTTPATLSEKLLAGTNITLTPSGAGDETLTIAASGGASGDVVGPGSATDNALCRYDSTTGKLIQDSVLTSANTTGDIQTVTAGQDFSIRTIDATGSTNGGDLTLEGADVVDGAGGDVNINPGLESGSGTNGRLNVNGGVIINAGVAGTQGLIIKASTGGSDRPLEIQNSAGTSITGFNASGNIFPFVNNNDSLGIGTSNRWLEVNSRDFTGDFFEMSTKGVLQGSDDSTPLGPTANIVLKATGTNTIGIFTADSAVADANATANLFIGGGNKTAGTGDGGNVNIDGGTSAGGAVGVVKLQQVAGNVGIGTAAPALKLDVSESSGTFGGSIAMSVTTSAVGFYYATAAGSQDCDTTCPAEDANAGYGSSSGVCLAVWTSTVGVSTCATAATNQKCLCMGAN